MKVSLYMAITVDGFIAKENGKTPWSPEEFTSYFNTVKKAGHIIVGRTTYEAFRPEDFVSMGHPFMVVLTKNSSLKDQEKIKFANSPQSALNLLAKHGFKEALVTGGAKTNTSFLKEKLISEVFIDVEPLIFGQGSPLFAPGPFDYELELLGTKNLSSQTIQLHYKLKK